MPFAKRLLNGVQDARLNDVVGQALPNILNSGVTLNFKLGLQLA
jgi:hypothetical protein